MSLHEVCLASARSRQAPVDDTEKIAVYLHSPKKALRDYLQTEKLSEMFTQGTKSSLLPFPRGAFPLPALAVTPPELSVTSVASRVYDSRARAQSDGSQSLSL